MIVIYFLAIIGIILLPFLIVDLYHNFRKWFFRIHIGRWCDFDLWSKAVNRRTEKWLINPPVVPKKDNTRGVLYDKIRGNYGRVTIQSWQEAGLYMGIDRFPAVKRKYLRGLLNGDGKLKKRHENIDVALLGYAIAMYSYDGLERENLECLVDQIYELVLKTKGDEATVPYRSFQKNRRYVDTIGFVCPFLFLYSHLKQDYRVSELAYNQLKEYIEILHPATGFPPHSFDIITGTPSGAYDWGRGIGWLSLGLVESRRVVLMYPARERIKYEKYICSAILALAENLLRFQKNDGSFSFFVCDKSSFGEGSSTVLSGLLLLESYIISNEKKYLVAAGRVISFLRTITQRNGALDMCQGDTKGVGFYSMAFGYMPFAQGLLSLLIKRYVGKNC